MNEEKKNLDATKKRVKKGKIGIVIGILVAVTFIIAAMVLLYADDIFKGFETEKEIIGEEEPKEIFYVVEPEFDEIGSLYNTVVSVKVDGNYGFVIRAFY